MTASRAGASGAKALLLAGFLAAAVVPSQGAISGSVGGWVKDEAGAPQMGAAVSLLTAEGRVARRVFTDHKGEFSIEGLFPGKYAVKVNLSRFIPLTRDSIDIRSGIRTVLDVSLHSLFASLQLAYGSRGEIRDMTEDWRWTLRAGHSRRPALRLTPSQDRRETDRLLRRVSGAFSETRAYAEVAGGAGVRPSALANQSDLGTSFALATSLFGENAVTVSGNVGYSAAAASPTTAFRTSFSRDLGFGAPEVSLTVRQLQADVGASRAFLDPGQARDGAPSLETVTLGFSDRAQLGESTHLEYGFLYESVSFVDRLDFISPFARMVREFSDGRTLELRYASGAPRPDEAVREGDQLRRSVQSLGMFPRVALDHGRATVQRSEHIELAYRERVGKGKVEAAVFQDVISDAAVTALAPDHLVGGGDLLPDLFSRSSTLNGGRHFTRGYRVSYARKLADQLEAALGYSNTGVLTRDEAAGPTNGMAGLRRTLGMERAHLATASLSTILPRSDTRLQSSYQWVSRQAVMAADLYNDFASASDPGWNIVIRQPIPLEAGLPGKLEASAEFRNLLKAGYLPIQTGDGSTLYLLPAIRSYRGSLSFIF